jgi:hypothetical protein
MIEIAIGTPNPRLLIVQYDNTQFCSGANRNFYRGRETTDGNNVSSPFTVIAA